MLNLGVPPSLPNQNPVVLSVYPDLACLTAMPEAVPKLSSPVVILFALKLLTFASVTAPSCKSPVRIGSSATENDKTEEGLLSAPTLLIAVTVAGDVATDLVHGLASWFGFLLNSIFVRSYPVGAVSKLTLH